MEEVKKRRRRRRSKANQDPSAKVGQRIGAFSHADEETVWLHGYGVYIGNFIPPAELLSLNPFAPLIIKAGGSPKLKMDDKREMWGFECHWGPEALVRSWIGERKVVTIGQGND